MIFSILVKFIKLFKYVYILLLFCFLLLAIYIILNQELTLFDLLSNNKILNLNIMFKDNLPNKFKTFIDFDNNNINIIKTYNGSIAYDYTTMQSTITYNNIIKTYNLNNISDMIKYLLIINTAI